MKHAGRSPSLLKRYGVFNYTRNTGEADKFGSSDGRNIQPRMAANITITL